MKKIALGLLCILVMFAFAACGNSGNSETSSTSEVSSSNSDTSSGTVSAVSSNNDAIKIVKDLVGSGNGKYIFEFSNEDKVIKDKNGDFYVNREGGSSEGMDCINIRVFTEVKEGDNISQDNIGWYFVSKSDGKVFEMKDPNETKLKAVN